MKLNSDDINAISAMICLICGASLIGGMVYTLIGFWPLFYIGLVSVLVFVGSAIVRSYK
jgi:hypothetical protein